MINPESPSERPSVLMKSLAHRFIRFLPGAGATAFCQTVSSKFCSGRDERYQPDRFPGSDGASKKLQLSGAICHVKRLRCGAAIVSDRAPAANGLLSRAQTEADRISRHACAVFRGRGVGKVGRCGSKRAPRLAMRERACDLNRADRERSEESVFLMKRSIPPALPSVGDDRAPSRDKFPAPGTTSRTSTGCQFNGSVGRQCIR